MRLLCSTVLGALMLLPLPASAATITLDGVCTSFESSPCFGSIAMTIRAFEATRETPVSVTASGPVRIIGFGFQPLDPSPLYDLAFTSTSGLVFTNNAISHPSLGTFATSIDFPGDTPLEGFNFTVTNPNGSLVLQPFEFNGRGYMAVAQVVNTETGAQAYRAAPWTQQQAEVVPMSPVPEPGSMVLLGTGLAAAWRARRRRRAD